MRISVLYIIIIFTFSFIIALQCIDRFIYSQSGQDNNADILLIYLSTDKKTYSVGEIIRLIITVYNNDNNINNNENNNTTLNPVPIKIDVIKTHDELLWWYNPRDISTSEIVDSFYINSNPDGSSSFYNISTIESGRYQINANSGIETNASSSSSFTQIAVKSIFFTIPSLMFYISIGFFVGLIIVIFFGQHIANALQLKENEDKIVLVEVLRFVCLTGIASSFLLTLLFSDVEIGTNSPVGLVKKDDLVTINGTIKHTGEWVVNIGGGKEDNYSSGIQIPATVIIFGVAGGYLRYLYGLRYLYTDKKERQEYSDSIDKSWGDIDINDNLALFKHSLRSLALFFLSPLLAVAVWFVLFQGGTTGKHAIAALSFTIGLVTEEAIQAIIAFARNILGGLKGATSAIGARPTALAAAEDKKSPTILSKVPSDKSTAVALKPEITVTFSEPIDKSSLNNSTFYLLDINDKKIDGDVSLNNECLVAKFTPKQDLANLSRYIAIVTSELRDIAGNRLNAIHKWSFTTI